jgi:hypothetical protein
MLLELTEFISTYPTRAQHLECETIIQDTIEKHPEEASRLWVA